MIARKFDAAAQKRRAEALVNLEIEAMRLARLGAPSGAHYELHLMEGYPAGLFARPPVDFRKTPIRLVQVDRHRDEGLRFSFQAHSNNMLPYSFALPEVLVEAWSRYLRRSYMVEDGENKIVPGPDMDFAKQYNYAQLMLCDVLAEVDRACDRLPMIHFTTMNITKIMNGRIPEDIQSRLTPSQG